MADQNTTYALEGKRPTQILSPRDAQELARMLAQCNADKCAVVPWGGGTLQHLGSAPVQYDAVLQTTNLNQIVEYAADDLTGTFGAGMTLAEIERVLNENGQFLPIDVPHPETATIGGVLASGMNGTLRLRYGPARDFMLGNRFATVDGDVIKAGSKVVKNVAGYELHKVQVGAFGTLGVITEATFKLFPKPPAEILMWASFKTLTDACAAVPKIWGLVVPPLAIELFDAFAGKMVNPKEEGAWAIAARFGGSKTAMAVVRDLVGQIAQEQDALDVHAVDEMTPSLRAIANMPATLRDKSPDALLVRVSVPPKELHAALRILLDFSPAPHIFAHAAITSIYASFQCDAATFAPLVTKLRMALRDIRGHLVIESAPDAVKQNLAIWDEVGASLKMMQALKRKFDPNNILNPGRFVAGI